VNVIVAKNLAGIVRPTSGAAISTVRARASSTQQLQLEQPVRIMPLMLH